MYQEKYYIYVYITIYMYIYTFFIHIHYFWDKEMTTCIKNSAHASDLSNILPPNLSWTLQENPRVNQTRVVQLTGSGIDSIR
jgi:hypothetical protein